ncbi:hypothetical protein P7K49_022007 [Saguinus oedipus]|uniref:Calponin-homology (CH) domain-containing protein n=1 Tax=Saguinus oedipus TaxID=9490 RepID=A0ABQ9UV46_SAGOE|nr:hypothetical protein P7K49_022007 [Saguinus oedipus]
MKRFRLEDLLRAYIMYAAQIYTDWANHYLAKSGHKRLIKDLQQDVTDGVLLAQIIQVVAAIDLPQLSTVKGQLSHWRPSSLPIGH